jgi:GDP/UDP-N,N'-diacetylbacillosamine 2-epimerase (hydrolysing)
LKRRRKIGLVTVARSDFGIYESVVQQLEDIPFFELQLLVTGAHFSPEFGDTVRDIEAQGYSYKAGLEMLLSSDSPQAVGKSVGLGIISLAQSFAEDRPDILLVLGDRVDMIVGPLAAVSFNIPVAHIGGGAVTEGAIDELIRHAITKMSHLHFVTCEQYAQRVLQMGEEPWRVINTGSPALDRIVVHDPLPMESLSERVGLDLQRETFLVTFHPVTLETARLEEQVEALIVALEESGKQIILTFPNSDTGSRYIIERFERFAVSLPNRARMLKNAGSDIYLSLMATVSAMVGNSSSGIAEAPSFRLPVVNIGTRQDGKVHAVNVIDVGYSREEITRGMAKALDAGFRGRLSDLKSPYGDGKAGEAIVGILHDVSIDDQLLRKKFIEQA